MQPIYPFRAKAKRVKNRRPDVLEQQQARLYLTAVFRKLASEPDLIAVVKENIDTFKGKQHIRNSAKKTLARLEWHFDAEQPDIELLATEVLADDYIGQKYREFPLLFKGVLTEDERFEALSATFTP